MTYSDKLKSPQWQKKRLQILERDGWQCVCCHSGDKNLQVHHVVYKKRDPWDYPDELYQTLCVDCHELRQQIVDKIVNALRIALKDVPTPRLEAVSQFIVSRAMEEMGGVK